MQLAILTLNLLAFSYLIKHYKEQAQIQSILFKKHRIRPFKFDFIQKDNKALTRNFYRIYKYIHLQLSVGTRVEEIFKSMYRVVYNKKLKNVLFEMSVIVSHSFDVNKGIQHLKKQMNDDEGLLFISIIENMQTSGLSLKAFERLDQMLFQKYLSNIRKETQKVKRLYFKAVMVFTLVVTIMLVFPLIDQMLVSAKIIFQ